MDSGDLKAGSRIVYTRRSRKKSSTPVIEKQQPEDDSFTTLTTRLEPQDSGCEKRDEVENLKTPSPLDNAKKTGSDCVQVINGPDVEKQDSGCEKQAPDTENLNSTLENAAEKTTTTSESVQVVTSSVNDDKIMFNLSKETPKNAIEDLRKRLDSELHQVRMQLEKLEGKKLQLTSYNNNVSNSTHGAGNDMIYGSADGRNVVGYNTVQSQRPIVEPVIDNRALVRVNSVVGHHEVRPMVLSRVNSDMGAARNIEPRPYYSRQLSVAVMENNYRDVEFVEKEKRTPKANQYYRNSEFLLGKDRLPPESNKRLKTNNGRRHSLQTGRHAFGSSSSFKSCSALLQKLMKHKFGWVFNVPVDAKTLGLADYHIIIKYPMDLGTIKTRLSENRYTSPMEFAEDVRLVFRNAMTYNPEGHDVHVMAEELSRIFEERWAVIETEYNPYLNGGQMYQELPTPTSGRVPAQSHFPTTAVLPVNVIARTEESMAANMVIEPKIQRPHIVRTPVPKKPKARDLNKRDMTYDEKQKLSTNLQGLPSEKLDAIVQIIKRRNTALSQHDDEIEVDIDNVDAETLWELDRFVTNYKKGLSKNKRKAELARQATTVANGTAAPTNTGPAVTAMQPERSAFGDGGEHLSLDGQKQQNNDDRSSSSSSSSSDSSSSDSDSDSSSADGSLHSPKT